MHLNLKVNGEGREIADVPVDLSLLRLLRDRLGLTGTKDACEQGECGSCSVLLDGACVASCLVPAGQAGGSVVETIEGLNTDAAMAALQAAFVAAGAVQCGFCTPGLLVAALNLVRFGDDLSEADIREELAGNLCRCTGYTKVIEAVRATARALSLVGTP